MVHTKPVLFELSRAHPGTQMTEIAWQCGNLYCLRTILSPQTVFRMFAAGPNLKGFHKEGCTYEYRFSSVEEGREMIDAVVLARADLRWSAGVLWRVGVALCVQPHRGGDNEWVGDVTPLIPWAPPLPRHP